MTPSEIYNQRLQDPLSDMRDYLPYLRSIAHGTVFEVGVRDGVSTSAFLLGLDDKAEGRLYSVDINPKCGGLFNNKRWHFINADSYLVGLPDFQIDVLLIDGAHDFEHAFSDLHKFSRRVKPGGLILMHDVQPAPEWEETIRRERWFPVDECRLAWDAFTGLHPTWKTEIKPGMTGMGVCHVQ